MAFAWATWHGHGPAETSALVMSRTVSSAVLASRSFTTTWAPSDAKRTAAALPIPLPAPVTTATRPVKRGSDIVATETREADRSSNRHGRWAREGGHLAEVRTGSRSHPRTVGV